MDGLIQLPEPDSSQKAHEGLAAIVESFAMGLSAPLPVAPQTAFTFLEKSDSTPQARINAIREAYHGNVQFEGEVARSLYLRRTYPSLESLMEGRVHDLGFEEWTDRLYRPLHEAFHSREGAA
jgi:exodeoxyribonuclease V gamma subunit